MRSGSTRTRRPTCGAAKRIMLLGLAGVLVGGCASGLVRNPLPSGIAQEQAVVVKGPPNIRFWADEVPANPTAAFRHIAGDLPPIGRGAKRINGRPLVDILALSGGGGDGAFGAGILAGWTRHGTRPEFQIVTGVSAGAIIAPFAFLGPAYDQTLREVWTQYETKDLGQIKGLQGILGGDALVDTSGLKNLIAAYLSDDVLAKIADEYRRGRILMVLTTNLDAQRPVVWNMGALAASGYPGANKLFHDIILASSAIPGAFSPVRIAVEVNGHIYDELHVDGGTTREIFISPMQVPLARFDALYDRPPIRRVYLIKNGREQPVFNPVEQKTLPIAGRAISTLILNQSAGEIYRIYRRTKDAGGEFHLIAIPPDFPYTTTQIFDPNYQTKLFDYGENIGRRGVPWLRQPADLIPGRQRSATVKLIPVEPKTTTASPSFSVEGALTGFPATSKD